MVFRPTNNRQNNKQPVSYIHEVKIREILNRFAWRNVIILFGKKIAAKDLLLQNIHRRRLFTGCQDWVHKSSPPYWGAQRAGNGKVITPTTKYGNHHSGFDQEAAPEGVSFDKKDVLQGFCLLLDGQVGHRHHPHQHHHDHPHDHCITKCYSGRRLQCSSSWGLCLVNLGYRCRSIIFVSGQDGRYFFVNQILQHERCRFLIFLRHKEGWFLVEYRFKCFGILHKSDAWFTFVLLNFAPFILCW